MADKKRKKFSEGGRAERMRERRMADIEKDYQKALAKGKSDKEAKAKRDQRIADARDDYAKRTGADRTETRAAEKAAEARLSAARRSPDKFTRPVSVTAEGSKPLETAKIDLTEKVSVPRVGSQSFSSAFAEARKGGKKTFEWNGKSYTTEMRGEKKPATSARAAAPAAGSTSTPRYGANFGKPSITAGKPQEASASKKLDALSMLQGDSVLRNPGSQPTDVGKQRRAAIANAFGLIPRAISSRVDRIRARGEASDPTLKKAKGGKVKKYAKGGKIDGIAVRGKTRAKRKK